MTATINAAETKTFCVNHPDTETYLRCNKCGKPVCMKCVQRTPVGYRCNECLGIQRAGYYTASTLDYIIASVIALLLGAVAGFAMGLVGGSLGFFTIIIAIFVGPLAGGIISEAIRRAISKRRGRYLALIATASVVAGAVLVLFAPVLPFVLAGRFDILVRVGFNIGFWVFLALAASTLYGALTLIIVFRFTFDGSCASQSVKRETSTAMLAEITITNLAIIDELNLKFAPGFNVLTGETGAGKSIILDALGLLLGGRAQSELIRAGAEETRVEGIFLLNPVARDLLAAPLEENGITLEDDSMILARELHRAGRATGRVNGRAVTGAVLQQIGDKLVDIHGQSEHLSLLRPKEHIDLLDRYGNLWEQRSEVTKLVRQLRKVRQELRDLVKDTRETARKIDRLTFVIQEIDDAKLKPGEDVELKSERDLLAHAETRATVADEAYHALYGGGEDEKGALDLINQAIQAVRGLEKFDPEIKSTLEQAESAGAVMDDLARTLREYRDSIEFNPKRLEHIEDRLDLIFRLKRKYGDTIEQVLEFEKTSRQELDAVTHAEERMNELREQDARLVEQAGILAEKLSQARNSAAEKLSSEIENQLQDLGMPKSKFGVALNRIEDAHGLIVGDKRFGFESSGIDKVEFLVSPNPGEPLKPLAKIASGGETSRMMLALKAVLGAADRTPTLIFDEIDQGIGGRMGGVVGKKLWGLTTSVNGSGHNAHQVICITHLPQIASYGDAHFHIRKAVVDERTITQADVLKDKRRVEELAGMLGAVTDINRASAREMLREVSKEKEQS